MLVRSFQPLMSVKKTMEIAVMYVLTRIVATTVLASMVSVCWMMKKLVKVIIIDHTLALSRIMF